MLFRRPLVPCVLAYAAGLWLVHDIFHQWPAGAIGILAIVVIIAAGLAVWKKNITPIYLLALMLLGSMVMGLCERNADVAHDLVNQLQSPGARVISGTVDAISELADIEKSRVLLTDINVTSGSQMISIPGKMQLTLEDGNLAGADDMPVTGARLAFPGRIRHPSSLQNFFGYNRAESLRHEAIYSSATPLALKGIVRVRQGSAGILGFIEKRLIGFRADITENLLLTMWQREGRLMVAMLFNDMRSLTDSEKQIFRESGTFHLFAVSGMHVAILGLVLNLFFRALRFGVRASWVTTAIVLLFYLWIIGFVPSATRSYLMLVAFTAAYMLGREVDAMTSLVLAIAAIIAFDPAAPWKAGFVLSVVGVGSIVLFTPLLRLWFPWPGEKHTLSFLGRRASDAMNLLMATIAVSVVMLPIQVYYFGFWNMMSPAANLLQAALSWFVLSAGVLTAAAGLVDIETGHLVGQSASAIMRVIYMISKWAAETDWAIFYFRQIPIWLMLSCYAIIISGYYLVHRDAPEFLLKSRARFATHACCCLGLLIIFQYWADWRRPALELWALDVGQGDATLIRFPNGETMLIDGGKSEPDMGRLVVVQQLRGLGIDRLNYIIATHDDDDHTGGLASVIETIGCRTLLIPDGLEAKSLSTKRMLQAAKAHYCVVREVHAGHIARAEPALIEILNPVPRPDLLQNLQPEFAVSEQTTSPAMINSLALVQPSDNDQSVVIRISYGNFSALLMGDAGLAVESRLINERLLTETTILKAGHHGSKTSTGEEFLVDVNPSATLISCSATNRFGHPAREVLHRLTHAGTKVLRTDTHGAIQIQTNGNTIKIRQVQQP